MDKIIETKKIIEQLKNIANSAIKNRNYNRALSAISVCAGILYSFNQWYKDDDLESMLLDLSQALVKTPMKKEYGNVIYYDGFGLDTRGLEINYCKAIVEGGFKLFYVTIKDSKDKQPHLKYELRNHDVEYIYLDKKKSYIEQISDLNKIFLAIKPEHAFFYTLPNDVVGTVVFNAMDGYVTRYQIDLTDHAFWLGVNALDICLDSRDIGQSIQRYERKIPIEKIIRIKPALYIDTMAKIEPLPFDTTKFRYIFSGGALYKTLGDADNTFYYVISELLKDNTLKFVYVGNGDTTEIDKLKTRFSDQVFYFQERSDFYELIKGCTLYLNTYPMFGGLMMRYAALAGKIPLTIKHGDEANGILIDQDDRKIEYDSAVDLINDAKKLLNDESYRTEREKLLDGATISFEVFSRNLISLMKDGKTEYKSAFINVDTEQFRKEFLARFDINNAMDSYLINKKHLCLFTDFPYAFIMGLPRKIIKKLKEKTK